MNGLQKWVFSMLKTHCGEQFQAAMGMSVDEVQAACARGDKAVLQRVKMHGEQLQQKAPDACQKAAEWAQTAFPAVGAAGNTQTINPTIERTQKYEL